MISCEELADKYYWCSPPIPHYYATVKNLSLCELQIRETDCGLIEIAQPGVDGNRNVVLITPLLAEDVIAVLSAVVQRIRGLPYEPV